MSKAVKTEEKIIGVAIENLVSSKFNSRKTFNDDSIAELADSIKVNGLINPITVRQVDKENFEIVAGERRKRAFELLERETIPCRLKDLTDQEVEEIQLAENVQREELSIIDEAEALSKFYKKHKSYQKVAELVNKSVPYVVGRIELLNLIPKLKKKVTEEVIPVTLAVTISRYNPEAQKKINEHFFEYTDNHIPTKETLLDYVSNEVHIPLNDSPFDLKDKKLNPKMGACTDCKFNTGVGKSLFADITEESHCTKGSCYNMKVQKQLQNRINELNKTPDKSVLLFLSNDYGYPEEFKAINKEAERQLDIKLNFKEIKVYKSYHFEPADEKEPEAVYAMVINKYRYYDGDFKLDIGDELWVKRSKVKSSRSGNGRSKANEVPSNESPLEQRERRMLKRFNREDNLDKIEVRKDIVKEILKVNLPLKDSIREEIARTVFFNTKNNLFVLRLFGFDVEGYEDRDTASLDSWEFRDDPDEETVMKKFIASIKDDEYLLHLLKVCTAADHLDILYTQGDVNITETEHDRLIEIAHEHGINPGDFFKLYQDLRQEARIEEENSLLAAKQKVEEKENYAKEQVKLGADGETEIAQVVGKGPKALVKLDEDILKKAARKLLVKVPKDVTKEVLAADIHKRVKELSK